MPNLVTYLTRTPIYLIDMWFGMALGMDTKKYLYVEREIGLHDQNKTTILISIVQMITMEGYMTF